MTDPRLPDTLRAEVARSLRPVRPLGSPWRRGALPALVGLSLFVVVLGAFGLRHDARVVGVLRLFGGSAAQVGVGLLLLVAALAESIPGRRAARSRLAVLAALALSLMGALTAATFAASPTRVPASGAHYFEVCLSRSFLLGLAPLAAALVLLLRGLLSRPLAVGALAGLGAGLFADASWRLYCEVSDPAHVLSAHLGAVLSDAALGAGVVWLHARLSRR
jgi:hypothetical protein